VIHIDKQLTSLIQFAHHNCYCQFDTP